MIYYLPLESYNERYTYQLANWTVSRFKEQGIPYKVINGIQLPQATHIRNSVALDPVGRSYFTLTQTAKLVELLDSKITSDDVIYMQDLFQPGYEALPYIVQQTNIKPTIATHLLAQSIDPNDFTFPMREWMRHFELMVDKTASVIFVASSCQAEAMRTALFNCRVEVVGLPFDKNEVRNRVAQKPYFQRKNRVVFSSRWDIEKQPEFYLKVAQIMKSNYPDWEFCVCTGQPKLRSNSPHLLQIAREAEASGLITIYENLSKNEYYEILANSKIQFNCALQDFVSNTLNEASALGTLSLLPAYLSFPEAVNNNSNQLYTPWSVKDACNKMTQMIEEPVLNEVSYSADRQHETLNKVIKVLQEFAGEKRT